MPWGFLPFNFYFMDGLGFALAGAGLNFVSNLFGSSKQSQSNNYAADKYYQGVKDTNAANLAIMREQNQFNLAQSLAANRYNSAAEQRSRLIAAGISPSAMAQTSGAQAAMASAAPSAKMDAPQYLSPADTQLWQIVGGAVNDFISNMQLSKQLESQSIANTKGRLDLLTYKSEKEQSLLRQMNEVKASDLNNQEKQQRLAYLGSELEHMQTMWRKSENQADLESENTSAQTRQLNVQTAYQELINSDLPQKLQREADLTSAKTQQILHSIVYDWAALRQSALNIERQLQSGERIARWQLDQRGFEMQQNWRQFYHTLQLQRDELGLQRDKFKFNKIMDIFQQSFGSYFNTQGLASPVIRSVFR